MQMLSDHENHGHEGVGVRAREEATGVKAARPAVPELLAPAKAAGAAADAQGSCHTISLTTAYGDLVAAEEVTDSEFGAALRRIYDEAVPRANAVVVLDGVTHTRNSFIEFVRQFNDWAARQRSASAPA